MPEWRIDSAEQASSIVDELRRRRAELLGKEVELERRYPRLAAGYRGRIADIQVREEKLFINLETEPGEIRPFLIGSKDPRTAADIIRHIERTRIRVR